MKLFVEGGGDSRELHIRCQEGYRKLLQRAGFKDHMPRIVACGGRYQAYDRFKTAQKQGDQAMLLVDSEAPVAPSYMAWQYLWKRDRWKRPAGAVDDQAQLMVQCMETWIVADLDSLRQYFGPKLRASALPALVNLEGRPKDAIQSDLEQATRNCGRDRQYRKGKKSFETLGRLNPDVLKARLPHFKEFCEALNRIVSSS